MLFMLFCFYLPKVLQTGCVCFNHNLYFSRSFCFLCTFRSPFPSSFRPLLVLLQLFKEELTQVKEGMKHINDLAHQLAISDVHLSMENARALEHLNSRWKVLQVELTAGSALSVWLCQQGLCPAVSHVIWSHECVRWTLRVYDALTPEASTLSTLACEGRWCVCVWAWVHDDFKAR